MPDPYMPHPYVTDPYMSGPYMPDPYMPDPYMPHPYMKVGAEWRALTPEEKDGWKRVGKVPAPPAE